MKKRLNALFALIISVFMAVTCLAGCNLVTVDNERDMNQIIATVSIEDGVKGDIRKKEAIIAYLNYGYMYTQYYGYSQKQTFNLIIDGLISDEILLQNAMKEMDSGAVPFDQAGLINSDYEKWNVKRYLSETEINNAVYETRFGLNELLDSYDETKNATTKSDTLSEEVRTIPTNATNAEKKLSDAEKKDYINTAFDINSSKERRSAFNDVITLLDNNGLLGNAYDGTIESTEYYKNSVQTYLESALIGKYRDMLNAYERGKVTFEMLETAYSEKYEEQKTWNNADFVKALSDATASSPVLYSAFGTYGYVYNLLLGLNEEQEKAISEIDAELSKADKVERRREILNGVTAKDLRSTWILSGYDFDGVKFTGDYTFATDPANALPFQGTVKDHTPEDTTDNKYGVTSVKEFTLDQFIELVNTYVYGETYKNSDYKIPSGEIYASFDGKNIDVSEYDAKIQDLLFAFSTDAGSLNTYKGYVIKPAVDGSNTEEFVESFANAGRQIIEYGNNSYCVVASDYGYHFMFYSQVFTPDYSAGATLVDYLNNLSGKNESKDYWKAQLAEMVNGWDDYEETESYLYLLMSEMSSARVSNAQSERENNIVNEYTYAKSGVTKYEKAYKDLLAE